MGLSLGMETLAGTLFVLCTMHAQFCTLFFFFNLTNMMAYPTVPCGSAKTAGLRTVHESLEWLALVTRAKIIGDTVLGRLPPQARHRQQTETNP